MRFQTVALLGAVMLTTAAFGCTNGKVTPAETALTACQTFTAALNTATALNNAHSLSEKQQGLVDKAVAIADPICNGPAPAVDATAFEVVSVSSAAQIINAVIGGQ